MSFNQSRWPRWAALPSTVAALTLLMGSFSFAAEPVRGGVVTALLTAEVSSLDPIFTNSPGGDSATYNLFAENLIDILPSGEAKPVLATSWTWSDDRKAITFKLRSGVKFHDGTPFDADAVKFNIERSRDPKLTSSSKQYWVNLDAVKVIDPLTVEFTFKEPSVAMLAVIAAEPGVMLSPTAIKKEGENFARKPVGTGPFQIVSWTAGKVETARFDGYWNKDDAGQPLPYLDGVVIRYVPNATVRLVELQAGSAQLGDAVLDKDFEKIKRDPSLVLMDTHMAIDHFCNFNNAEPPFDNLDLRKAVSLAIDRVALAKAISGNAGTPLGGMLPPTSWASDPSVKPVAYDLEGAKAAYAASGHKGPIKLSLVARDPDPQIAQIMQSMLKKAGIDVTIEQMERNAWMNLVLKGKAELSLGRSTLPDVDPDITMSSYYGRDAARNSIRVENPKIWELLERARKETSQEARRSLYGQAQQILVDNQNQLYLFSRPVKYVARKELQGVTLELGGGAWLFDRAWLAPAE